MKYRHVMLFSDLDGTLFDDEKKVPAANKAAIDKFCAQGGLFGLSTGRIPSNIGTFADDLTINGPSILYNGCAIYDWKNQQYLYRAWLDESVVEPFLAWILEEYKTVNIQVYPEDEICFVSPVEFVNKELYELHHPCRFVSLRDVKKPWLKVLLQGDPETLLQIRQKAETVSGIGHLVLSKTDYVEILPEGCDKGSALKLAMQSPDMAGRISVAVGDYLNDAEILSAADISIAPSNAADEIKSLVDFVGCDNNSGIIADCIERIIPSLPDKFPMI